MRRQLFPFAVVPALHFGRDGKSKPTNSKTLHRSFAGLHILELCTEISKLMLVMMDFLLLVLFLSAGLLCSQMYQILALQICRDRDVLLRKYCFSFGFCLNYLLPPSPQLGQLKYNFFPTSKFQI